MNDPEVVIIGAGPAGLTAAYELARRGHEATVLEAERRARRKSGKADSAV